MSRGITPIGRNRFVHGAMVAGLLFGTLSTSVLAATVEEIVTQNGGGELVANAGSAIQGTCGPLVAANPAPNTAAGDLRDRCREMVQTVRVEGDDPNSTPPPNANYSYGFTVEDGSTFDAIRQFSGEETSSQGRFATQDANRQFSTIGARLDAIRQGVRGIGLVAREPDLTGGAASADERDADVGLGWFTNGALGSGDRDQTDNESEYNLHGWNATIGIDYAFRSGFVVGVAYGYAESDLDFADAAADFVNPVAGGGIESEGDIGSLFLSYPGERYYANAIVSVGNNDFDLSRRAVLVAPSPGPLATPAVDRTFTADTESDQVAAQGTFGMIFGDGPMSYDAYLGVDYLTIDVDGYTETEHDNLNGTPTPGLALTFDDQSIDSTQSILGFTIRMVGNTAAAVLQPYVTAEWRHEFENDSRTVEYRYLFALPGANPSFESPTDEPDEDWAQVTVGLGAQLTNSFFAFAQYATTLGLEDSVVNAFTIGLRGRF